jgi:hypothetical protein
MTEYKGFDIIPQKANPRSLIIVHHGKAGKIPKILEGVFTDRGTAKSLIDMYVDSKVA